jgi:hypothetical protein
MEKAGYLSACKTSLMAHYDQSERCKFLVVTGGEADIAGSADSFASVENDR